MLHEQHECAEHVRINNVRPAHHGHGQPRGTQEECRKHDIFSMVLELRLGACFTKENKTDFFPFLYADFKLAPYFSNFEDDPADASLKG